jgi:hypothetical protein
MDRGGRAAVQTDPRGADSDPNEGCVATGEAKRHSTNEPVEKIAHRDESGRIAKLIATFAKRYAMDTLNRVKDLVDNSEKEKESAKRSIDFFYGALSVLDQKASGLLSANAMMIAVAGIFHIDFNTPAPDFERHYIASWIIKALFWIVLLLLAVSSMICVWIFRVAWPQLSKAVRIKNVYNFAPELRELEKIFKCRTLLYQMTSWLTLVALFVIAAWFILATYFFGS